MRKNLDFVTMSTCRAQSSLHTRTASSLWRLMRRVSNPTACDVFTGRILTDTI